MKPIKKSFFWLTAALLVLSVAAGFAAAEGQSGTTLSASKTATGFWEIHRVYDWSIEKSADPSSIEIKPGESGVVKFTINVTRTLVSETVEIGVRGEICVTNGGGVATENLTITDVVQVKVGAGPFTDYVSQGVDVSANPVLDPGESDCYPYEVVFTPVAGALYKNIGRVTITNHSGHLGEPFGPGFNSPQQGVAADFSLPSEPTILEEDESASVVDTVDCPPGFTCTPNSGGPWPFNDSGSVEFYVEIHNDSAACGTSQVLHNTATLTEGDTGQQRQAWADVTITTGECVAQGCTPGYWKNHPGAWGPSGLTTGQSVSSVFASTPAPLASKTLLEALNFKGGSTLDGARQILLRAAVSAALNAAHPGVAYPLSLADVQAQVNGVVGGSDRSAILAVAAYLDNLNNAGCPLN